MVHDATVRSSNSSNTLEERLYLGRSQCPRWKYAQLRMLCQRRSAQRGHERPREKLDRGLRRWRPRAVHGLPPRGFHAARTPQTAVNTKPFPLEFVASFVAGVVKFCPWVCVVASISFWFVFSCVVVVGALIPCVVVFLVVRSH